MDCKDCKQEITYTVRYLGASVRRDGNTLASGVDRASAEQAILRDVWSTPLRPGDMRPYAQQIVAEALCECGPHQDLSFSGDALLKPLDASLRQAWQCDSIEQ